MHIRLYVAELTVLQSEGWFGLVRGHVGGFMSGTLGDAAAVLTLFALVGPSTMWLGSRYLREILCVCVGGGGQPGARSVQS